MDNTTAPSHTRKIISVSAAAWTLAILALCSIPGNELPDVSIASVDKIGHFSMFAAFAWLWMHALRIEVRARLRLVFAAGLAYAVLTEVYQGLMPLGREPDVWDAVANSAGLITGLGLWRISSRVSERVRSSGR